MPWFPFGIPQYTPPVQPGRVRMAREVRCPKCGERQDMPDDLRNAPYCLDELLESVTKTAS